MNPDLYYEGPTVKVKRGVFTNRETESVLWIPEGKTDGEIGEIIGCTTRTAHAHVMSVMKKMDCHNRAQLVSRMFLEGIISARQTALVLLLTLTTGLFTGFGRPLVSSGQLQLTPAGAGSSLTQQPYRHRNGGHRKAPARSVRLLRPARLRRREEV